MPKEPHCWRLFLRIGAYTAGAGLPIVVGLVLSVLLIPSTYSEPHEDTVAAVTSPYAALRLEPPSQNSRAYPRVDLGGGRELEYVGTFCANATYTKTSKFSRALEKLGATSRPTSGLGEDAKQVAAPGWMLRPARRVVEDFETPVHATKIAQPKSKPANIRDEIVTFAYGPARVMGAPHQVTADSKLRVIISDPDQRAVHVLDPNGKTSFSILGDHGRRLHLPAGVAVDAEDNIYIADSDRGMVLVYNQHGQFLRYIGNFHGESMYSGPSGIAIDQKAGRLYLTDTPRNLVFILDLQGNVLKRVGRDRNGNGGGEFVSPTEIAVSDHGIVVLDTDQSRIQVLDFDGNRVSSYRLAPGVDRNNGLAVDRDGDIYISYVDGATIGTYRPDGTSMGTFGQIGSRIGEFRLPGGLWVDADNRIYVADTGNARVQVFQLSTAATPPR